MTVAPIRPDIEAPEAETTEVVKFENPLLLMLAWVLIAIGWVVGILSIPCNWCLGAMRVGWDSARRLGGI